MSFCFNNEPMDIHTELRCDILITRKKIFQWGPLSTGFHDVICIVLLLYNLSYLFATSPSFSIVLLIIHRWLLFFKWYRKGAIGTSTRNMHIKQKPIPLYFLARYVILHLATTYIETLAQLIRKKEYNYFRLPYVWILCMLYTKNIPDSLFKEKIYL